MSERQTERQRQRGKVYVCELVIIQMGALLCIKNKRHIMEFSHENYIIYHKVTYYYIS